MMYTIKKGQYKRDIEVTQSNHFPPTKLHLAWWVLILLKFNRMKNLILLRIIPFIVFCCLTACQSETPRYTKVVVLVDITDSTLTKQIDVNKAAHFLLEQSQINTIEEASSNGLSIEFSTLSDRYENPLSETFDLPIGGSMLTQITKERIEQQIDIQKKISTTLKQLKNAPEQQKESSNLYSPITDAIKRLNEGDSHKRILLIFSDLMHHSHVGGSLYDDPEAFVEMIRDKAFSPSKEVDVVVVFRPQTLAEDKRYREVIQPLWKEALKGAHLKFIPQI